MKCPRCKSEKITFQKKDDVVGFLTNDTLTGSKAVCQECGKTFDPDIAYLESNMTPEEKAWSRASFAFWLSLLVTWVFGFVGIAISIIGGIWCSVKAKQYSQKGKTK